MANDRQKRQEVPGVSRRRKAKRFGQKVHHPGQARLIMSCELAGTSRARAQIKRNIYAVKIIGLKLRPYYRFNDI